MTKCSRSMPEAGVGRVRGARCGSDSLAWGFTLVELLVVMSIIALLIAILLPVLSQTRAVAQRSVCANNLKQLGIAFYAYAADSNGSFPPMNLAPSASAGAAAVNSNWWSNLLVRGDYLLEDSVPGSSSGEQNGTFRNGALLCPTVKSIPNRGGAYTWKSLGGSYGVNFTHGVFHYGVSPMLYQLKRPSEALLLTETMERQLTDPHTENQRPTHLRCPLHPGTGIDWVGTGFRPQAAPRHLDRTLNVLFMDGHVETLAYEQVRSNEGDMFAHDQKP